MLTLISNVLPKFRSSARMWHLIHTFIGWLYEFTWRRGNIFNFGRQLQLSANRDRTSWLRMERIYLASRIISVLMHSICSFQCTQALSTDNVLHSITSPAASSAGLSRWVFHYLWTADEHIKHTPTVLSLVCRAGVSLNFKKCKVFTGKINLLGACHTPGLLGTRSSIFGHKNRLSTPLYSNGAEVILWIIECIATLRSKLSRKCCLHFRSS